VTHNHKKGGMQWSPITDSQTVHVRTCFDTLWHETNSTLCWRNTALLVKCRTSLW